MATPFQPLKVLIFGAGAVGTYVGGSLGLAGHAVTFVTHPEAATELRKRGLRLDLSKDPRRKSKQAPVLRPQSFTVSSSLEEALRQAQFDAAIYGLKAFDTSAALEGMKPFAAKLPPLLCLSNGIDNEPAIAQALGADKVIAGTLTSAIARRRAGDIVLEKLRGVGLARGHALSERLAVALDEAHLKCRLYDDGASMKWSKMLTNLIANATSAILDMSPAEIFAHRGLFRLEMKMLRECLTVMKAQVLPVMDLPGTPVRALAWATRLPTWLSRPIVSRAAAGGRGGKMPSFHIDLHSGRGQSEVEYLHGAVARKGGELGIPTPVNKLLTDTLMELTRGEIPMDELARRPERLLAML